ncbi:hypothetical protein GOP47_0015626 [Adiantum capillus-veneris]|uniref:Protein kinase domain-containing protein n=1 Tax=Adiantum capillus-veneris TaxID=13818 RepID=A0A9D4ZDD6_ADICA|nr:hypothetical protein GOP47_0015626 [Adiantum capillus-veneris]
MDSQNAFKQKRNVVVVGIKLRPSSRELLTWTLAKFTKPGDEVVVLHIVSKQQFSSLSSTGVDTQPNMPAVAPRPNVTQGEVEGIFDSVAGVYDRFCSVKQLKVVCGGSSVRRRLVKEVKHYKAVKLILGAPGTQKSTENSSLALAKYCSIHLPKTCSVLVIQHGQVVMEKAGELMSGDCIGVQIMRDKTAGHQLSKSRGKYNAQNHDDFQKAECIRCSSSRVWKLSSLIVHPYKYVPPQVQGLRTCVLDLSTMAATSGSRAKCPTPCTNSRGWSHVSDECYLRNCCSAEELNEDRSGQQKLVQKCISSDLEHCQRRLTDMSACNRGWPLVKTDWNSSEPFPSKISLGLESSSHAYKDRHEFSRKTDCKAKNVTGRNRHTTIDIPQGWPLRHQSVTAINSDNAHSRARSMSVVEWVLQLPERSKGVLERSPKAANQEMPIRFATETDQKCMDFSNQVAKRHSGTEADRTLLEKCFQICKDGNCLAFGIADLEKSTDNFSEDNMIGRGGCSRVYRGVLSDARVVAIKCFDMLVASTSDDEFFTELEIVSSLHHPHIVELLGYCVDSQQHRYLIYNFAMEGNLEQKLHQGDKAVLPWSVRYKVALGIGKALEYLHKFAQQLVIHRDVKSSNILLQSDFTPQLTDFGLSRWASTSSTFLTCNDVVGTFGYLAPEYFMFGKVSDKTDVYSFGVVLLELVSGKHPIESVGANSQENLILWAKPLIEDESSHNQVVDRRLGKEYDADQVKNVLIAASLCLQHAPHARPSMSKILKVLRGETVELELRQDSMSIDGYVGPSHGDYDIYNHLTLALCGVDDDLSSQAGSDQKFCHGHSNKLIERYLRGRSSSFD